MPTKKRGKYNSKQNIILLLYNVRDLQKKYWKIKILNLSNPSICSSAFVRREEKNTNTVLMPFLYRKNKVKNLNFYSV